MQSESDFYDHYKESFSVQRDNVSERNKLSLGMLVVIVLLAGFIYDPNTMNSEVNTCVSNYVNGLAFEIKYVNTGLVFLTLLVIVKYYQAEFKVERMRQYLSECEQKLSEDRQYQILREEISSSKSFSWFGIVVNFCYILLLPLGIIMVSFIRIYSELAWDSDFKYVDFLGLGLIILFSFLYLSNRFLKEEYFKKDLHPDMTFIQRVLSYLRLR